MKQYTAVINRILKEGVWKTNRTGIPALTIAGASSTYDCSESFPLLTLKKVPFKSVIGELVSFLQGATNAAVFRENGTKIWDQNANENEAWLTNPHRLGEDDLGEGLYGSSWRCWPAYKTIADGRFNRKAVIDAISNTGYHLFATRPGVEIWFKEIDQLFECYKKIMTNPDDRRIIFHAWNPAVADQIALMPCHLLYQFIANKETRVLDLCMMIRSQDYFLGAAFNIASCAALLSLMAKLTGYTPGKFVHHMNDCHLYQNHIAGVEELLSREEKMLPTLQVSIPVSVRVAPILHNQQDFDQLLNDLTVNNFILTGYDSHPAIVVPMAV